MAEVEWGILPITDECEMRDGTMWVVIHIDTYFYRSLDAVNRIFESFLWEKPRPTLLDRIKQRFHEVIDGKKI